MCVLKNNVLKTQLFLTIFISSLNALEEASGEKKLNLRIGFDLTQGSNGAPSLRIRDFEESSDLAHRAADEGLEGNPKPSPVIRADSFSDSDEKVPDDDASKQVDNDVRKSDNDEDYDNSGDGNRIRSTKGLNFAEYEPEENPRLHEKYKAPESSESDENRRRQKREAGLYDYLKRKSKKIVKRYKKKINNLQ